MALTEHTLTLTTKKPGTDAPLDGTWSLSVVANPPILKDTENHVVFAGQHQLVTQDGVATIDVPETGQANLLPAEARYRLSFRSTDRSMALGPFTFPVTEDMTLDDIAEVTDVAITPSVLTQALAAAADAEESRVAAAAAAAAAEAVGTTNDTIIAGRIADPESATAGALTAAFVRVNPEALWENLPQPFYVAHRGGPNIAPEESMTAYRLAVEAGAHALEADVRLLGDGRLAIMHDATVDRTTTGTGNVSDHSVTTYARLVIDSAGLMGTSGWPTEAPPLVETWLREFGNHVCLMPQMYVPEAYAVFNALVERLGINKQTIVIQSTDGATLTSALADGYGAMSLGEFVTPNFGPAQARGDQFVGMNLANLTAQHVTDAHAAGLRLVPYSTSSKLQRDDALALGVDGLFSDDPGYLADAYIPRRSDLLIAQGATHGHARIAGNAATFTAPNILTFAGASGVVSTTRLGYMEPADPTNFHIDFDVRITTATSGSAFFWLGHDRFYTPAAGQNFDGYLMSIHTNQHVTGERMVDGVRAEYLGYQKTITGGGQNVWQSYRVTITPTAVTWLKKTTGETFTYPTAAPIVGRTVVVGATTAGVEFRNLVFDAA